MNSHAPKMLSRISNWPRVAYLVLVRLSHMGSDVGQIFSTASLHRDHSILYALVLRKIESIIGVQWFQKNPNPRAHCSSGKRGLPIFTLNGGPRVGIFLEPLNTNDRFFYSYTTTIRYSTV